MQATSKVKSQPGSPRRDTLPTVADEGVVVTDLSLTQLAIDRGAITILTDISRQSGRGDAVTSLPSEITDALRGRSFHDWSGLRIQFRGGKYKYCCRVYLVQPRNGGITQPMVTFHLQRGTSASETIHQIATECSLTDREEQVLVGISTGLTSKELAERMSISPNTVKTFLRLIMVKMRVSTRAAIVGKLLNYDGTNDQ